jgi:MFS family permease
VAVTLIGSAASRALRERDFSLLIGARVTSQIGNQVAVLALAFAVLDLTDSAADLGLVLASSTASLAVFLLIGGAVADRTPKRRLMVVTDLVRFGSQGLLTVLLVTGAARLWQVVALQIVAGAAAGLFVPAVSAIQPEVVPKELAKDANALRGLAIAAATVVGPAIGGLLLVFLRPGAVLAVDSLSFLFSALLVARMRAGRAPASTTRNLLVGLAEGWQEFRSHRWLWTVTAQNATVRMLALAPFMVLGPVLMHHTSAGARGWALVLTMIGLGALLGGLVSIKLHPRRQLRLAVAGVLLFAPMMVLLAVGAPAWLVAAAALGGGVEQSVFWTFWQTTLQQHVAPEKLSRVSSYDWLGAYAFEPVGYALAGPVALVLGNARTLLAGAVVVVVATALSLSVRQVWQLSSAPANPPAATAVKTG